MSEKQGKGKQQPIKSKKGMVVNRKHNRTVNFDVQQNEPQWERVKLDGMETGVIRLKHTDVRLRRSFEHGNRWVNV